MIRYEQYARHVISEYGTGNMTQHIKVCERKDTPNVGQMCLSRNQEDMSIISFKFDIKKIKKLVVASIIKHDLPF
jgi:hypothetical protein